MQARAHGNDKAHLAKECADRIARRFARPVIEITDIEMANARNSDPSTSAAAAREVEQSGGAAAQRILCFEVVRVRPGLTAAEIAEAAGLERHAPSRRLPELRAAGLVVNGGKRKCRIMGRGSLTWYPAGPLQLCLF